MDPKILEKQAEENKKLHDFLAPIEKTSVELAKIALNELTKHFDDLIFQNTSALTEEDRAKYEEKGRDFCISIQRIFSTTDIPADYLTHGIEKLITTLSSVKKYIEGTNNEIDAEVMDRIWGAKNPITNTYIGDCVTFGQKVLKLQEIRNSQGNNPEDWKIFTRK